MWLAGTRPLARSQHAPAKEFARGGESIALSADSRRRTGESTKLAPLIAQHAHWPTAARCVQGVFRDGSATPLRRMRARFDRNSRYCAAQFASIEFLAIEAPG